MVKDVIVNDFLRRIRKDCRLGPSHVSLFWALSVIHNRQGSRGYIDFWKEDVVGIAKISFTTFYRCMRDLHAFGYVRYAPSFHAKVRSKLWFLIK